MSDFRRWMCIIFIEMDRQRAYTEMLERYRPLVWRMCWFRARGNWDRCNDLVQEVSIALWLHFDALRPDATPAEKRAWIYWQCRSTLDLQRRLQKPPMQPLTTLLEETVADEDARHTQEEIEHLMASLSPEEQRLVGLYLEGYKTKEIADLMNLSHDTVYQRMHRVVGKARKAMVVVFLLLVATSIAIAVVPSWRQRTHFLSVSLPRSPLPSRQWPLIACRNPWKSTPWYLVRCRHLLSTSTSPQRILSLSATPLPHPLPSSGCQRPSPSRAVFLLSAV